MLKFCEFLHRIRVIFYLRFRPLDVPMYAFGTKNEDFRSKSPYPLEGTKVGQVKVINPISEIKLGSRNAFAKKNASAKNIASIMIAFARFPPANPTIV